MPGIEFVLNGRTVHAEGFTPQTTLLDFVRSQGLTGAKEGCAEGECGACTVLMVRPRGTGSRYVPVNSCLLFLPMAAGQEVYTVEALARDGRLAEVQREMSAGGGSQCGYCTPGFVVSLFAEQYRPGREGPCDVHALGGNLCRCTGYRPIRDAALAVGPAPEDAFRERLARAAPAIGRMASPGFARPESLSECLALMAQHPEARLIAGGADLAVESNLRGKRFAYLISVEGLAELRVRRMPTRTDKVPNTSPSAASASTDLNGAAVASACAELKSRLAPVAASLPGCTFAQVVEAAYRQRIPLFAQGYYRTPGIHFDQKTGQGEPFHYFAYGAAVSEVEVDGYTGDHRLLRTDILQDVGESLAPLIDRGQIEGGFIQGLGWLTLEELLWDAQGRVATAGASTYKLPSWSELPEVFEVEFLERPAEGGAILGSKAIGEPAREAIRDAIAAFGPGGVVALDSPLTPERVYWAVERVRAGCEVAAQAIS
jgi:aerobic-type carbon monoxide dehydrogenase small subunit (CoxS/CutS family)